MPAPVLPPALVSGDLVAVIAPASPIREPYLSRGVERIEALGLRVRRGTHVAARGRYTAGSIEQRVDDLRAMLVDPEVRAIWVARGGYGSPHLLPHLDPETLRADPKPLIGASDATALLLWWLRAGVTCLHGPMPAMEIAAGRWDPDELRHHLCEPEPAGTLAGAPLRPLHPGRAQGRLTGGCLSLVVASLGTPWEIETDGALLFLEDKNTKPYQIDRMLTQLDQAGKLEGVAAVVFGEMNGCVQTEDQGYTLDEVLTDLTAELGIPVAMGAASGHTEGVHHPLPFGALATLDSDSGRLVLDSPLVA